MNTAAYAIVDQVDTAEQSIIVVKKQATGEIFTIVTHADGRDYVVAPTGRICSNPDETTSQSIRPMLDWMVNNVW